MTLHARTLALALLAAVTLFLLGMERDALRTLPIKAPNATYDAVREQLRRFIGSETRVIGALYAYQYIHDFDFHSNYAIDVECGYPVTGAPHRANPCWESEANAHPSQRATALGTELAFRGSNVYITLDVHDYYQNKWVDPRVWGQHFVPVASIFIPEQAEPFTVYFARERADEMARDRNMLPNRSGTLGPVFWVTYGREYLESTAVTGQEWRGKSVDEKRALLERCMREAGWFGNKPLFIDTIRAWVDYYFTDRWWALYSAASPEERTLFSAMEYAMHVFMISAWSAIPQDGAL